MGVRAGLHFDGSIAAGGADELPDGPSGCSSMPQQPSGVRFQPVDADEVAPGSPTLTGPTGHCSRTRLPSVRIHLL
jgi:hypothetical protein